VRERLLAPGLRFRANPAYDVVVLDRLDAEARSRLAASGDDAEAYGALVPRPGSAGDLRSLSHDLALLLLTLAEPGPLPGYVARRLGPEAEPTVRRLVLDGVLQVELDGAFVDGPRAGDLLAGTWPADGEVARLDEAALRYGQELAAWLPEDALAGRLYRYGRAPLSPGLRARFGPDAEVARVLGVAPGGAVAGAVAAAGWARPAPPPGWTHPWWEWTPARRGAAPASAAMVKLYVSPRVEDAVDALAAAAPTIARMPGVLGFKVGAGLGGLCRPDKVVVYLDGRESLLALATRLGADLAGVRAHGVPFTAPVTTDRLLSWGVDPPAPDGVARRTSWRGWLVANLAHSLRQARAAGPGRLEPWRFAVERLRLAGVDPRTWTPSGGFWREGVDAR
jgi:hypothetical protein